MGIVGGYLDTFDVLFVLCFAGFPMDGKLCERMSMG
jgi:hypothetical protein